MKTPTLGFLCPACNRGMRPVCDACEEEAALARGEESLREARDRGRRRREIQNLPLLLDIEEVFQNQVEVIVEPDIDECGFTGRHHATLSGLNWLDAWGVDLTEETAVAALKTSLAKALRELADDLDSLK